MQLNDIVYVYGSGFGIVIKTEKTSPGGQTGTVRLSDGSLTEALPQSALAVLPEFLTEFILDDSHFSYFSPALLSAGQKIIRSGALLALSVSGSLRPFQITAVFGDTACRTGSHTVTLTVRGDSIRFSCTCTRSGSCRHGAALVCHLQNILKDLNAFRVGPAFAADLYPYSPALSGSSGSLADYTRNRAVDELLRAEGCLPVAVRNFLKSLGSDPAPDPEQIRRAVERVFSSPCRDPGIKDELIRGLVFCEATAPSFDALMKQPWSLSRTVMKYYTAARTLKAPSRYYWQPDADLYSILAPFYNGFPAGVLSAILNRNYNYDFLPGVLTACLEDIRIFPVPEQAKLLAEFCDRRLSADLRAIAAGAAVRLPDSGYFADFLRNNDGTPRDRYPRRGYSSADVGAVDPEKLKKYFSWTWQAEEVEGTPCLAVNVTVTGTDPKIAALTFYQVSESAYAVSFNGIEKTADSAVAERLLIDLHTQYGSAIDDALTKLKTEIEQRKYQETVAALQKKLRSFSASLPAPAVLLEESARASLEFIITRVSGWDGSSWALEMKIGRTKKYVVKDAAAMLSRFRSGETFSYGKGFTFTHLPSNIIEEQRPALEFLMLHTGTYGGFRDSRYMNLTDYVFSAFLQTLRGCRINFEGKDYLVRLDQVECPVSVDRRCILRAGIKKSGYTLLDTGDRLYLLGKKEPFIDVIPSSPEQHALFRFAFDNDGENLEPVLDSFCETVYSRFYEEITVADELKERIRLSELEIRAYFDYENDVISVRTELFIEDKKIAPDRIRLPLDKSRYAGYLRFLESLGFADGVLRDQGRILAFLSMDMTALKKLCKVYLSDSIQNKKLTRFSTQIIRIQRESNIMEAFLEHSEYSDAELEQILSAIRHKKKFVLLTGDRIVDLTSEDAAEFEQTVEELGLDGKHLSERHEISMPQALRAFAHENGCRIDEYLYKMISEIRGFKTSRIPVPPLNAVLRPYQEEGFRWLRILSDYHVGGILADDMGLGKTLEFITLLRSDPAPGPDLVVCPKSLVFNWISEFRRFSPDTGVREIYGTPVKRRESIGNISADDRTVYVTSYDSLRNDLESYSGISFRYLILDEAQYIKNVQAQKSRSVKLLSAAHRFALTGTPVENSVLDLWSIFDFIMPGYFDEVSTFRARYCNDSKYTSQIARRIAPFVLRRTKQDVLKDLPDKYERILTVEMKKEQRKYYDAYKKEAADAIKRGGKAFDILPYLTRLRQICDAPDMFIENYAGGSAKLDAVKDLVASSLREGHRILLFSQFVQALERIEAMLGDMSVEYYKITGATSAGERIRQMNEFNASDQVGVFLISLKAGGTGLNLTGADTVIHLDPWWNTAAEDQATDRAHRIGQKRNVQVIRLICENSVEQRIIELQDLKRDLIGQLISDSDRSVTGITLEDISFILK